MTKVLLDPTGEMDSAERQPLELPTSLDGLTVGLLDISKARGDLFLDRVERQKSCVQGVSHVMCREGRGADGRRFGSKC